MTRKEAKEILTHNWTRIDNPNYSESELDEAFFMAIEALQFAEHFDLLKEFQSLQEVVRCKDCKHWHNNTEFCDVWSLANIAQRTLADDYCSLAELREKSEVEE